ncbi:MAG: hypothetical protein HC932_04695 [Thermales bacterium]|nr:hypothetical protein [Thermales bacterium]
MLKLSKFSYLLEVEKRAPNNIQACLAVDGSKIGILPDANRVKIEPCRNIREQRFKFNKLGNLWGTGQPAAPQQVLPTVPNLIRTGGPYTKDPNVYKNREHPFAYIGSNAYSQEEGNNICFNEFFNRVNGGNSSIGVTSVYEASWSRLWAWDGVEITNAWHIWYHQSQGHCIANK